MYISDVFLCVIIFHETAFKTCCAKWRAKFPFFLSFLSFPPSFPSFLLSFLSSFPPSLPPSWPFFLLSSFLPFFLPSFLPSFLPFFLSFLLFFFFFFFLSFFLTFFLSAYSFPFYLPAESSKHCEVSGQLYWWWIFLYCDWVLWGENEVLLTQLFWEY